MLKIKELNFRKQTVSHNCENDQNEGYKLIVRFGLNIHAPAKVILLETLKQLINKILKVLTAATV